MVRFGLIKTMQRGFICLELLKASLFSIGYKLFLLLFVFLYTYQSSQAMNIS